MSGKWAAPKTPTPDVLPITVVVGQPVFALWHVNKSKSEWQAATVLSLDRTKSLPEGYESTLFAAPPAKLFAPFPHPPAEVVWRKMCQRGQSCNFGRVGQA